jgi:hypothetical protein
MSIAKASVKTEPTIARFVAFISLARYFRASLRYRRCHRTTRKAGTAADGYSCQYGRGKCGNLDPGPRGADSRKESMHSHLTREEAAHRVLAECLWGDYHFEVSELLQRIDERSDYFDSFLIMRIVDNARHASPLLRALFSPDRVLSVLRDQRRTDGHRPRMLRRAMVEANISGNYAAAPVRQWVR